MLCYMIKQSSAAPSCESALRGHPTVERPPDRGGRRIALRHHAAIVAAELRRMRRGWSEPGDAPTPRVTA